MTFTPGIPDPQILRLFHISQEPDQDGGGRIGREEMTCPGAPHGLGLIPSSLLFKRELLRTYSGLQKTP